MLRAYAVAIASALAGASAAHHIIKPDLTLPEIEEDHQEPSTKGEKG